METKYDKVKNFEGSLHLRSCKHFSKQLALFDEWMELYLEPLDKISSGIHLKEKSPIIVLLARMFNDFESSKLLLLYGLPEQANMTMRDIIECMMLIRLFGNDSKLALRWMENLKEYHPSYVKKRLDELEIDCPEYAFYGTLSTLTHANLLSVVSTVTEKMLTNNLLLQTYHFGGINNPSWIELVFNILFIFLSVTLASVLPPVYSPYMSNPEEWWNKQVELSGKLKELLGDSIQFEEVEKTGKGKAERDMVFKKLGLIKIKATFFDKEKIASDKGFPDS